SLRSTAMAIAASALTSVAGLSLMMLADFRPFQKAGSSIAVALAVGCLASLTLAPSLYLLAGRTIFWPRKKIGPPKPLTGDLWDRIAGAVTRRPLVATLLVLLVLAVPSINSLYTTTTNNIFDELSSDWTSVRGFEILKRDFSPGTMGPLTILVETEGQDNALDDDLGWSLLLRLADRLSEHPMVDNVYCPAQPRGRGTTRYESIDDLDPDSPIMKAIAGYFFNADFTAARLEVFLKEGPYTDASVAAARQLQLIAQNVTSGAPGIKRVLMAGPSSTIADIKDVARRDFRITAAAVLIAVYVILLVVLRRPVLGLFLIGGTLLSFMTALGVADWVFVGLLGEPGLDWKIKFFLLVLLVAVGVDYNIYVCTRIGQERLRRPLTEAVRVALARTGGIVSACGIIVAGTFASMIAGTLSLMVQLGFALALGILVDTFLVRPLMVPAVALMLARVSERRKAKRQRPDNSDAAR
ncbi:MAG: MMPL family transporter, partial [Anaerolineaceae bacterium]|nr:MMPL family transporter [Anaerolineaceae bacterium]